MLKTRIMPTLLFRDFGLVKGIGFDSWRRIGGVIQAVKVYNMREVDELVFLDIKATLENRFPDFELIDEIADECFMPLAVGGGIKTLDDIKNLLRVGADKITINSKAIADPDFIKQVANKFGSQCIVVSIDVKKHNNQYEIFTHSGTKATGIDPAFFAKKVESFGAGEIILTSINLDGTMKGYDIELVKKVSDAVSVPVIASGGAGNYEHMAEAIIEGGASAVAAASIFHFTQQTPLKAKRFLKERGINVRL